jgi:chromosome partitioning protein
LYIVWPRKREAIMKTITIASTKGGSGKSTIISALAVQAAQETPKVAMMDLNFDQGSLTHWWHVRGKPQSPLLAQYIENVPGDIRVIAAMGYEWLFIDSPPTGMDLIEQAIAVADAVIVPVRPGFFDVIAVQTVTGMCRQHRKPFAFVLSAVDSRYKVLTRQTLAALAGLGPVFKTQISYRRPWIAALVIGKTGPELDKDLRPEIGALWGEVKNLAEKGSVQ